MDTAAPLIHIGYHKTGTTWLQRRVFSKARLGYQLVAGPRELQRTMMHLPPFSFDLETFRETYLPGISEAHRADLVPVLSSESFSGTPHFRSGNDSQIHADRLVEAFPNARVLVMIREQASMLLSLYKTYIRMGGAASFHQYVPSQDGSRAPLFRFEHLEYDRLIRYYQGLFGTGNLLVLPYELLQNSPADFMSALTQFSGAPDKIANTETFMNISPSALTLTVKRALNTCFVRGAFNPAPLTSLEVDNDALRRLASKVDRRIPAGVREASDRRWVEFAKRSVADRYAKSNSHTQELTDLDLNRLGYSVL